MKMTSVKISRDNQRVLEPVWGYKRPRVKSAVMAWFQVQEITPRYQWYQTYMNFSFDRSEDAVAFSLVWS